MSEAGSQTWSCCIGEARFDSNVLLRVLSDQLVSVMPLDNYSFAAEGINSQSVFSAWTIVCFDVPFVVGWTDNTSEGLILHAVVAKKGDIVGTWFIVWVSQAMRICVASSLHFELSGLSIHFNKKSFIFPFLFLPRWVVLSWKDSKDLSFSRWMFGCGFALIRKKQLLSCPSGKCQTGVITTGKHESIKQLLNGVYLSNLYFGWSSPDAALELTNSHLLCIFINAEAFT